MTCQTYNTHKDTIKTICIQQKTDINDDKSQHNTSICTWVTNENVIIKNNNNLTNVDLIMLKMKATCSS